MNLKAQTFFNALPRGRVQPAGRRSEQGTALLFVMVLLGAIGILLLGNAVVLRSLTREVQLVDQRQRNRLVKQSQMGTNAPSELKRQPTAPSKP